MPAAEAISDAPVVIDAMDELSALDDAGKAPPSTPEKSAPAAKPEKKAETPKPVEKKPEVKQTEEKPAPEAKKGSVVDPKAVAKPEDSPQKQNFAALRDKVTKFETENVQLQNQVKELTAKLSTNAVPKEYEERYTSLQAEHKTLRERLAQHDFTTTDDFQDNFYKPYVGSWADGRQQLAGLRYTDDGGTPRELSVDEADDLLTPTKSDAKALRDAATLFKDDHIALTLISTHRNQIKQQYSRMNNAKANAQKLSDVRREKEAADGKEHAGRIQTLWTAANAGLAKTNPLFQESADDPEGSELLKKGLAEADHAFSDDPQLTPEKRIEAHAKIRLKSAAYDRVKPLLAAKDERIAELEAEVKAFRESEPETASSANGTKAVGKTVLEELEEMDRANR